MQGVAVALLHDIHDIAAAALDLRRDIAVPGLEQRRAVPVPLLDQHGLVGCPATQSLRDAGPVGAAGLQEGRDVRRAVLGQSDRSEEHTSELQSLMRNSY